MAGCDERGHYVYEAVNVIRPAVKQKNRSSLGRSRLDVSDVEQSGLDLL
jgi:hypothetical protein